MLHTPDYTDANPNGKGYLTASELKKEPQKHIRCKQFLWFGFYVLFILWMKRDLADGQAMEKRS
jgi:hypothetical protein